MHAALEMRIMRSRKIGNSLSAVHQIGKPEASFAFWLQSQILLTVLLELQIGKKLYFF